VRALARHAEATASLILRRDGPRIGLVRRCLGRVRELLFPSEVRPRRPALYEPSSREVIALRETLERILVENILSFWYPRAIDVADGGYRLNHDAAGRWKGPADKRLVTQARMLWFFSRLSGTPYGTAEHRAAADHGYRFLRDRMWDQRFGGFYWKVDASGGRATEPAKHLYGQAAALYALTEYAKASREEPALALVRELFRLLEERAHDPSYGGYRESFERDWSLTPAPARGCLGFGSEIKLANTHLHLLEAMTTHYLLTGDSLARDRLLELILIQSNATIRPRIGVSTDAHLRDWTPLRGRRHERASYGHDLENVWLLIEACRAAGLPNVPLLGLYRAVFRHALRYGFDRERGGFYSGGRLDAPADERTKIWWVQAEGLLGALQMYRLTRERVYFACFTRTLGWIVDHQVDWAHGEWHARVARNGTPSGDKADGWKAAYHTGRAMIDALALLPGPAAPAPPEMR
jgi:cellobiose epimerase